MKIYSSKTLTEKQLNSLLKRKRIDSAGVMEKVKPILNDIKKSGYKAVLKYARLYDGLSGNTLAVTKDEIKKKALKIEPELKTAIDTAAANIKKFHKLQKPAEYSIETTAGVKCSRKYFSIESVGIYIPGGNAVLFSTLLMLGLPAQIAGCKRIVICSPLKEGLNPALAYAAVLCGVEEFYNIGGAQAIALMAYGTEKTIKVDKIFGPGSQYVTTAKSLVSIDPGGCVIDMPAGPSEILIIADEYADARFVAADLLSQAEHGVDSSAILITNSMQLAEAVNKEVLVQLKNIPAKEIAMKSLADSFILITDSIEEAVSFSNKYAPEHLILNIKSFKQIIKKIRNAGSVFLGGYSPESAGDYASGTNHTLPTYGYAKAAGGVTIESFMKSISVQELSYKGLKNLSGTIIKMAEAEGLTAHANAVRVRLKR